MQPSPAPGDAALAERVREMSGGSFRLVDTGDVMGRCLEAAVDLPLGWRLRDVPIAPHGTDLGLRLISAAPKGGDRVASADLLAGLDFLASVVTSLATPPDGETAAMDLIWDMYAPTSDSDAPQRVSMARKWHRNWHPEISASVPVTTVETAWAHVVFNWRQMSCSLPRFATVEREDAAGSEPVLALKQDSVCGLWLFMALCEHSCNPSCGLMHDGTDLWFVPLRPIKAGERISCSYVRLSVMCQPAEDRQDELKRWGFACGCNRCAAELQQPWLQGEFNFEVVACLPSEDDDERERYWETLNELRTLARRVEGGASPSEQALLQLMAIFAPEARLEDAHLQHLAVCSKLYGEDSPVTVFAAKLQSDPHGLFVDAGVSADGDDLRARVRELWRSGFQARSWPRRRGDAGFIAARRH